MALSPPRARLALLLITIAAFALRSVGIESGLPHLVEPDYEIAAQVVQLERGATTKGSVRARDFATYPLLVARTTALAGGPLPPGGEGASLEEHLARASHRVLRVRWVVALLSVLIVPGAYLIARTCLSPGWSLMAATVTAVSLLDVCFSQQARAHAPAAALVALAVAATVRLRRRGDLRSYLLAGAMTAMAIGALQSAVAVLFPLAAAHLLRENGGRRALLDPRALVPLVLVAATLPVFYPFLFSPGPPGQAQTEEAQVAFGNHILTSVELNGVGFVNVARTLWWYEPGLLALLIAAAVLWCTRPRGERDDARSERARRRDLGVLLAYVVPYGLVVGLFEQTFERFVLPLLPFLACFAAWGAKELMNRSRGQSVRIVSGGFVVAALLLPALASSSLVRLRSRPDTLHLAAAWLEEHVDPSAERVFLSPTPQRARASSSIDVPLMRTHETTRGLELLGRNSYALWNRYQERLEEMEKPPPVYPIRWMAVLEKDIPDDVVPDRLTWLNEVPSRWFATSGPGVFVVEVVEERTHLPELAAFRRALAEIGTLRARFSPDGERGTSEYPLLYQDRLEDGGSWPHVTARILRAEATGPVIEIYSVGVEDLSD